MSQNGFICRHPLASYFGLAYLLSWIIWSPLIAAAQGWTRAWLPSWWHFFGALGPITSALVITGLVEGSSGVRELLGRLVRWRVGLVWWVVPLLGPLAAFGLAAAVLRVTGAPWPEFSRLGATSEFPRMGLVAAFAFHALTFGVGEETGWRGFALLRLQGKHGALAATAALTAGWAVWHVPAFFYRAGYTSLLGPMLLGWLLSLFAGAILITWLFNSARGSLVPLLLWHGSINLVYTSEIASDGLLTVMSILIMVWAVLVVLVAGPVNLSRHPRATLPPAPSGLRAAA